jgi:hypothetical protein
MGFGSGRCAFHPLAHYISPADSYRVRIHTSGRVAPGIIHFIALKLQKLIDFWRSVAAQRTGDFKPGAVENSDIASHMMPEGDVVPAVQLEFPALYAFKYPAKHIGLFVLAFLFRGHDKCFLFKWNGFPGGD